MMALGGEPLLKPIESEVHLRAVIAEVSVEGPECFVEVGVHRI